tara:strand:- start:47 stop:1852 length:1806 start_codon:yes stop_codon:yes gene_type:complete
MQQLNEELITQFCSNKVDLLNTNNNSKKIYAGKWCFLDKSFEDFENDEDKFLVIDNIWKEKEVFNYDFNFSSYLVDKYSSLLSNYLNKTNNVKKSDRYWNILLLPWLIHYIPSQLYRWRTVQQAFKIQRKLSFLKIKNFKKIIPNKTLDFVTMIREDDEFNYFCYYKIFNFLRSEKNFDITFIEKTGSKLEAANNNKKFPLILLSKLLEKFNYYLLKNNSIIFDFKLIKKNHHFEFCKSLNQFPQYIFNREINHTNLKNFKYDTNSRDESKISFNELSPNFSSDLDFVNFLNDTIQYDIPKCFIEGYEAIIKETKNIPLKPKIVLSGFNHFYNEVFKVWIAEYLSINNCKFFISSHGGNNHLKYSSCLQFESKIADKKLTYTIPRNKNDLQLSPLKFIGLKKISKQKTYLSYVASPNTHYPFKAYRTNFCELNNYNNIKTLEKNLNKKIFKKLIYLPSKFSIKMETLKIKDLLLSNYIEKSNSLHRFANKSNLIICTYPESAFLESVFLSPTIIIFDYNNYEFLDCGIDLKEKLTNCKILFNDTKLAAKHINDVWENPNIWWNSIEVKKTIQIFQEKFCNITEKPLSSWTDFLKMELNNLK